MFKKILGMIRGIPADATEAAAGIPALTVKLQPYRLGSELSETEILGGVGPNGECWDTWRSDARGQWFKRISADSPADADRQIIAFDAASDDRDDDSLPDDVAAGQLLLRQLTTGDYETPGSPEEARENARLRIAARRYQGRMENWPMDDDDSAGDDDDES